jgi:tripartite-type tricarboxylate transporter receptor subunit TctC
MMLLTLVLAGCGEKQTGESTANEAASASQTSSDDSWPSKPITLICGYSAGGSSDLGSRYVAAALEKELGQPVVVENVPGSGSWVAWNQLLHNTPTDGYTFGLVNLNILYGEYDSENPREEGVDDFELLANHVIDYQVIAIRDDETRFSDFESLIAYSKDHDLLLAVPSVGINSGDSTVATYLTNNFGSQITMVPVDGAADAAAMFLAGDVDFLSANVGDVIGQDGYKVIVCFSDERSKYLPDVPTAIETGVCDYVSFSARGYAYMKGVDPAIVQKMTEALATAFDDEEYQANMENMGAELKLYTGTEYTDLLNSQLDERLDVWGLTRK